MSPAQIRGILPYVIGLAVAALLYIYAGEVKYAARAGELGPAVWPRMAIVLLAGACVFEIVRRLATSSVDERGIVELLRDDRANDVEAPRYPRLLIGGIVLVCIYALAVPALGFLIATFLFLVAFMYLGRYRNHKALWATSALVTVACGILFLRIAYVSLPRGLGLFGYITDAFFLIPGL